MQGSPFSIEPLSLDELPALIRRLRPPEERGRAVSQAVSEVLEVVRSRGDAAVVEYTARFDWAGATAGGLRVPEEEIEAAHRVAGPGLLAAVRTAHENVSWFHRQELPEGWEATGPYGQRLGLRIHPVERAGLYVPGGLGSYASTVIMNATPAKVAGVKELFICTPPGRDGKVNESVLATAWELGVTEIYRVGGAQAVAAMAFGTETIRRADVICGPGNAYVMEAKRQVYGAVGIDGLAGPSEVVVVADRSADPRLVAADLLAQEEHGSGATAVLVADSREFCEGVGREVSGLRRRFAAGAAARVAGSSANLHGLYPAGPADSCQAGAHEAASPAQVGVGSSAEVGAQPGDSFQDLAAAFVNGYAPEHLEIHLQNPREFAERVRAAGAIFLGAGTPTAFGDYIAGSNHVLPTGGSARFSSPLSVWAFLRRSSLIEVPPQAAAALAPSLALLALSEGFVFHRISAELRLGRDGAD